MEPVDSVAVYGDGCYKGLWEIAIRKQQHMENQQETELLKRDLFTITAYGFVGYFIV